MELIKVSSDKEKVKSILKITLLIEERIKNQNKDIMTPLIIVDYYEIIKELITSLLLLDGYKTLSHKDLVDYLVENYKEFSVKEITTLDNLRVLRNRVAYEGLLIEQAYLNRNEISFNSLINKLRTLIDNKLKV